MKYTWILLWQKEKIQNFEFGANLDIKYYIIYIASISIYIDDVHFFYSNKFLLEILPQLWDKWE